MSKQMRQCMVCTAIIDQTPCEYCGHDESRVVRVSYSTVECKTCDLSVEEEMMDKDGRCPSCLVQDEVDKAPKQEYMPHEGFKQCKMCGEDMFYHNFYKTKNGYSTWCKSCTSGYKRCRRLDKQEDGGG